MESIRTQFRVPAKPSDERSSEAFIGLKAHMAGRRWARDVGQRQPILRTISALDWRGIVGENTGASRHKAKPMALVVKTEVTDPAFLAGWF
jgi:hypothetical protein